jgi:hypothetical protein
MKRFQKYFDVEKTLPGYVEGQYSYGSKFVLTESWNDYLQGSEFTLTDNEIPDKVYRHGVGIASGQFRDKNGNIISITGNHHNLQNLFQYRPQPEIAYPETQTRIEREIVRETGIPGPKGDDGWAGPQGERGPRGNDGVQGVQGLRGVAGEKGEQGDKGDKGVTGDRGETGWTGYPGDKGLQGVDGPTGPKGEKGDQGIQGVAGEQGIQGEQGIPGIQGAEGSQGIQGLPGASGKDGKVGKTGKSGPRGAQGTQGKAGSKGDQGAKGDQGPIGPEGAQGPTGESPVLTAQYPLILEDNELTFDPKKIQEFLSSLIKSKSDADRVSHNMGMMASSGGGAVGIYKDRARIIKSVNDINFIGNNITVTRKGKQVDVSVTGGNAPGGGGTFYESTTVDAPLVVDLVDGDRWWNYDTGRLYTWIGIWAEI